jgi:hypothetical protein
VNEYSDGTDEWWAHIEAPYDGTRPLEERVRCRQCMDAWCGKVGGGYADNACPEGRKLWEAIRHDG